jgi:[protein-PII] uridylyltransferase
VDDAVRGLAEGLDLKVALVALGGYGRGELAPGSDIDLMVLHAERRADRVRAAAERVFYPFWDAGLSLGHAVRTVKECVAGVRERLDVACSVLDARLVWGDRSLFARLEAEVGRTLRSQPLRFLRLLSEDAAARQARFGSCSASLEPDLKDGSGGLRDLQSIGWAGWVATGARDRPSLVEGRLLRAREVDGLEAAEEFLVRLRSALHLSTGRRADRLHRELQPALAEDFGFTATAGLDGPDVLMRTLFEHARSIEHLRDVFLERVAEHGKGGLPPPVIPEPSTPEGVMAAFSWSAEHGAALPAAALDAIEAADLGEPPYPWTGATREAFVRVVGAPSGRGLEALDRAGMLSRFLPEWEPVRCRPQRDPYHQWTVDVHLARAAGEAAALLRSGGAGDAVAGRAVEAVPDAEALVLGALLHDIGKVGLGRHVEIGKEIAASALDRMAVSEPTRGHALFLVREHLLLADTATRRDLSDENLVLDVAARVGDPGRLAMLYLLTVADAASTGPHAWTPWRRALIRELVARVEHVLERGEMEPGRAALLEERQSAVRGLLAREPAPAVEAYLTRVPRPYLLAVAPERAAADFHLLGTPPGAAEVRTLSGAGDREGTYDLTVVAGDRPGLLARIAGALALSGLNILSAQAFTTEDGVALDLFVVEPAFRGDVDEERWRRFRTDLRKALEGRISLEYRVAEKRRHYPAPRVEVEPEVVVDNEASDFSTVVEVGAPDRIGLLFDLARTLQDLELDVHLAKVATYGGRVVDAFYVRDLYGRKIEDSDHAEEIRRALMARLAGTGP